MRISFNGTQYFALGKNGWGPLDAAELPQGVLNLNAGELYDTNTGLTSQYVDGNWVEKPETTIRATPEGPETGANTPQPTPERAPERPPAASSSPATVTNGVMDKPTGGKTMPGLTPTEERSPYAAYLQNLGLRGDQYLNPYQKYQTEQFAPLYGAYSLQNALALPSGGQGLGPFADWARVNTDRFGQGRTALSSLFNTGADVRQAAGRTYEGENMGDLGELGNVIYTALAPRYGTQAAAWLANKLGDLRKEWQTVGAQDQNTQPYLDYIRTKYAALA